MNEQPRHPLGPPLESTGGGRAEPAPADAAGVAAALGWSETQFRALFDSAPIGIDISRNQVLHYANVAFRRMFGYPETAEVRGIPLLDHVAPAYWQEVEERNRRREQGEPVPDDYETVGLRRDGSTFPIRLHVTRIDLPDGPATLAFVTDLTEQRRTEQAQRFLADASHRLSSSFDYEQTLPDVARLAVPFLGDWCLVDILQADQRLQRLAIAHPDPDKVALGWEVTRRFPAYRQHAAGPGYVVRTGDVQFVPEIADALLASATGDTEHLAMVQSLEWRSLIVVPLQAREQTIGAITVATAESRRRYGPADLALVQDLAARVGVAVDNARLYRAAQQAEAQSQRQAARMSALAWASRALSEAQLDLDDILAAISQQVAGLAGELCVIRLVSDDSQWLEPASVYHPDAELLAAARATFVRQLADEGWQGRVVQHGMTALLSPLAPEQYRAMIKPEHWPFYEHFGLFRFLVVPLRVRGQVIGTLTAGRHHAQPDFSPEDQAFLEDLADRAALAVANARLYRDAQAAILQREEFLSIASHELRTPLATTKAYSQMLVRELGRTRADEQRIREYAARVQRQVDRLETLTLELLDAARLQQGRLELRVQETELVDLVRQVLARFEQAPERTPDHRLILDAPAPVTGVWDASRLDQVVTNLVSNALKYSPQGGEVRVTVRQHDALAEVRVQDQGIGIPPEQQGQLFQPFARLATGNQGIPGVGLGLYITAQIVARHGGQIVLDSQPGLGSTFIVRLPFAPPEEPTA